jgi:hypothetical protein
VYTSLLSSCLFNFPKFPVCPLPFIPSSFIESFPYPCLLPLFSFSNFPSAFIEKVDLAGTLLIHIKELLGSNPGRYSRCSEIFVSFLSPSSKYLDSALTRSLLLTSKSFTIHLSSRDSAQCDLNIGPTFSGEANCRDKCNRFLSVAWPEFYVILYWKCTLKLI